jgi:Cd2+/Zn2+-exporting ATPase
LAFDLLNGRMTIASTAIAVQDDVIVNAVAATGLKAVPWHRRAGQDEGDGERRQQALFVAASGSFIVLGLSLHLVLAGGFLQAWTGADRPASPVEILAYAAAIVAGGRFVLLKAWYAARNLRPDMHLLMTLAVIGAILLGDWLEAATVSFLFALSLALENWSIGRARRAIASLLDLAPPTAHVLRSGGEEAVIPVSEVRLGSRFIVMPASASRSMDA